MISRWVKIVLLKYSDDSMLVLNSFLSIGTEDLYESCLIFVLFQNDRWRRPELDITDLGQVVFKYSDCRYSLQGFKSISCAFF